MIIVGTHHSLAQRSVQAILWLVSFAVLLYLVAPLLAIIPLSFTSGVDLVYPIPHFSLRWYEDFWSSKEWMGALRNSLTIGTMTMILATTLGTLAALGLTQDRFPLKPLISGFFLAPLVVPSISFAVGVYFFFSPFGLTESFWGIVLAHTTLAVPFVVITVSATLAGFDRNLIRAASSLGANPIRVFFRVILPLVLPGVVTGALFSFATSLDEVITVLFLAGPDQTTLPKQMFMGIRYELYPTITVSATILIGASVILLVLVMFLRRRGERLRAHA